MYQSDSNFLLNDDVCFSLNFKKSSKISQQLFIADAWTFSTFFVMACYLVGSSFSPTKCQLSVKCRLCLFCLFTPEQGIISKDWLTDILF